jgi:hypothetical protein
MTDGLKKELIEELSPINIADIKDLTHLPKNDNPVG